MLELEKEIQEAIEKNLPKLTGDALKKRLELINNLELDIKGKENRIISVEANNKILQKELDIQKELVKERETQLKVYQTREENIKTAENQIAYANLMNSIAQAKLEGSMEVTRLVFGNIKLRERIYGNEPVPVAGNPASQYNSGSPGTVGSGYRDQTRETEK